MKRHGELETLNVDCKAIERKPCETFRGELVGEVDLLALDLPTYADPRPSNLLGHHSIHVGHMPNRHELGDTLQTALDPTVKERSEGSSMYSHDICCLLKQAKLIRDGQVLAIESGVPQTLQKALDFRKIRECPGVSTRKKDLFRDVELA